MWGATKRRPSVKQVVFITHIANPHRPIYPFRSFLPFYLPASPLPVPSRHIILTAVMVYPSPRSTRQRQPKPTISAVLRYYSLQHPNTEPPPQHVQTPRKITLFDNHLPARLSARLGLNHSFTPIPERNPVLSTCRSAFIPDNQISSDRLFSTYPVACRATRCPISIGERRARRTWPLRA